MESGQGELFETNPAPWELDEADSLSVAQVVFSDAPFGPFDYLIPEGLSEEVQPGRRLSVPLGRGDRLVVGYCVARSEQAPRSRTLKPIEQVLDTETLISANLLRLSQWMSEYYLCPWGQALEAVLPAGVRQDAGARNITVLSVPTKVAARLASLELPPKQAELMRLLAGSPHPLTPQQLSQAAGCTVGPVNSLRKKNLIEARQVRVQPPPLDTPADARQTPPKLNPDQRAALDAILQTLRSAQHETLVVHGVTGSGKTEVYIRAIEEVVSYGRQAIVLVPEISLTPQTRQRFRGRFDKVAVLHSHMSPIERHSHWREIASGRVQVVVGARSAVFAPTPLLGLIVIDEEHDNSFKQDNAPRYHAREVALQRSQREGIPLVLGSATPSLESWRHAMDGDWQHVSMPRRVYDRPLPAVGTLDLRTEYRNPKSRGAISRQLHQAIVAALGDGGQVILLLNRRGHSTHIQCPACGHVLECQDCDIALTFHRTEARARCHWCDYDIPAPNRCPECGFEGIRFSGIGTQRLEAEVRSRFPEVQCLRMDSDTMRKPGSHEAALDRFRRGEVQILVGTQMIAKGLDFPNVTLVGVINADTALHLPDFRASERTFQLVTQVAGRTGRGQLGGRVLVQTFSPDHPAIVAATRHDYLMFADHELPVRRDLKLPPFTSMIRLIFRGPNENELSLFAQATGESLRKAADQAQLNYRMLGPAVAPVSRLRGLFRQHALLFAQDQRALREVVAAVTQDLKPPGEVQWVVDVDPLDML